MATVDAGTIEELLSAMARPPSLVPRPALVDAVGFNGRDLDRAVTKARRAGLVEEWSVRGWGRTLTLTPLACERLSITLDPSGERWIPAGTGAEDWTFGRSRESLEIDHTCPDGTGIFADRPDPDAPTAIDLDIANEAPSPDEPPRPRTIEERTHPGRRVTHRWILLGMSVIWPGPPDPAAPCEACVGRELRRLEYCCMCDRSFLDGQLGEPDEPPPEGLPVPCEDEPGYVTRNGVTVPERFARMMKG